MEDEGLPFALAMWIKRQQEEKLAHELNMANKNYEDDKQFFEWLKLIVANWKKLSMKEKMLVSSLVKRHQSVRTLTINQRSAVASIYIKHIG